MIRNLFLLASVGALLASAAEPIVCETTVAVGQQTRVCLESNPSTGYSWQLAEPLAADSPVKVELNLAPPCESRSEGDLPLVGAPTPTLVNITGLAPGSATLRLTYSRPWEKDEAPASEAVIHVTVSQK